MRGCTNLCKGLALLLMLIGTTPVLASSDPVPAGVDAVLKAAANRGEIIYRTVFETTLSAFPGSELGLLRLSQTIAPQWMTDDELDFIDKEDKAVADALARSKARGLMYYLDPALWNTRVDLGGGVTTGDTQENALSLALHIDREFNKGWNHTADINADFARRLGVTTRERIVTDLTTRKDVSSRLYGLNNVRLEIDRFSGYDYRFNAVFGAGYSFFTQNPKHSLALEIGLGMRFNRLAEPVPDEPLTLSEFVGRTDLRYRWDIMADLSLENRGTAFFGTNSMTFEDQLTLIAQINSHLSARFSFLVNYESDAPEGSSAVDTVTRATLSYSF